MAPWIIDFFLKLIELFTLIPSSWKNTDLLLNLLLKGEEALSTCLIPKL
jgi:hypothetical protein